MRVTTDLIDVLSTCCKAIIYIFYEQLDFSLAASHNLCHLFRRDRPSVFFLNELKLNISPLVKRTLLSTLLRFFEVTGGQLS